MKGTYRSEIEGMIDFYTEIGYDGKVDYSCSTDGRLMIGNELGALNEFKLNPVSPIDVFNQMKRYVISLNAKAKPLPLYGIYICLNSHEYQIFKLDSDFEHSYFTELKKWENPNDIKQYMEYTDTQFGWIEPNSIVAYNDLYFKNNKVKKTTSKKKNDFSSITAILKGQKVDTDRLSKDQFIEELRNPCYLPIIPYQWDETGDMERRMLDCIGASQLKKRLGAFFTPKAYAEKAAEYVKNIVANLSPDTEDYLIIDRCAGTGSLEESFTDEMLSHTILNTIVLSESSTLHGFYSGRVFAILPENMETDEEGLFIHGDALEKSFNESLKEIIEAYRATCKENGKELRLIFFENPPYAEPSGEATRSGNTQHGTTNNYISSLMKKDKKVIGRAITDLANKFIWSAFNYFDCDHYVVFAPIKYWKNQNLINEKFVEGFIGNRAEFHATESAAPVIHWENVHNNVSTEEINMEVYDIVNDCLCKKDNVVIKKINSSIINLLSDDNSRNTQQQLIAIITPHGGTPDFKHDALTNFHLKSFNGRETKMGKDNILQAVPLFAANCYECKDFTEKEILMKSGDGGLVYMEDRQFLLDCFVWCGLSDKNKCISNDELKNEYCFCQNTKADSILEEYEILHSPRYAGLLNRWKSILHEAEETEEYNPDEEYTYGLYQLNEEVNITGICKDDEGRVITDKTGKPKQGIIHPELDSQIKLLKADLKNFYNEKIAPKLFEYQLLK